MDFKCAFEEVEVIAVLEAGKRSLTEGREVTVAEVRERKG